jgi:hypothetical protein
MPYTPPVTLVDGTPVLWSEIESNLSDFRDWVNEIPVADVTAASIGRDALVRPNIGGWPTQGLFGDPQSLAADAFGAHQIPPVDFGAWGQEPERITLMPGASAVPSGRLLTKFGRTLYLHPLWDHDVQIHITGIIQVRVTNSSTTPAGTDTVYPDGAAGPAFGTPVSGLGYLQVYMRDREDGSETVYGTGRAKVYSQDAYNGVTALYGQLAADRFHVVYYGRLAGGRYLDFILGYAPENTDRIVQIDLSELTFTAEVS